MSREEAGNERRREELRKNKKEGILIRFSLKKKKGRGLFAKWLHQENIFMKSSFKRRLFVNSSLKTTPKETHQAKYKKP